MQLLALLIELHAKFLEEETWSLIVETFLEKVTRDMDQATQNFRKLKKGGRKAISTMGQHLLFTILKLSHQHKQRSVFKKTLDLVIFKLEKNCQMLNQASNLHILSTLILAFDHCFSYIDYK